MCDITGESGLLSKANLIQPSEFLSNQLLQFSSIPSTENTGTQEGTELPVIEILIDQIRCFNDEDTRNAFIEKLRDVLDSFSIFFEKVIHFDMFACLKRLNAVCLEDVPFIKKFIHFIWAPALKKLEVDRNGLLFQCQNYIQDDYANAEEMMKHDPPRFRNFIRFLGDFLCKRAQDDIKAKMVSCLEILVNSSRIDDIKFLMQQIYTHRTRLDIKSSSPIIVAIRNSIMERRDMAADNVARLFLTMDIVASTNGILDGTMLEFYRNKLGHEEMTELMGHHMTAVSITIPPLMGRVAGVESDVPVLMVQPKTSSSSSLDLAVFF